MYSVVCLNDLLAFLVVHQAIDVRESLHRLLDLSQQLSCPHDVSYVRVLRFKKESGGEASPATRGAFRGSGGPFFLLS